MELPPEMEQVRSDANTLLAAQGIVRLNILPNPIYECRVDDFLILAVSSPLLEEHSILAVLRSGEEERPWPLILSPLTKPEGNWLLLFCLNIPKNQIFWMQGDWTASLKGKAIYIRKIDSDFMEWHGKSLDEYNVFKGKSR